MVQFSLTNYVVTEGPDVVIELHLMRSGSLTDTSVVDVTIVQGTASSKNSIQ